MYKVSEGEVGDIVWKTVILSHTNDLEILELADAETNPPKNLQCNGSTPLVGTDPFFLQSPLEYTSVSLAGPHPCPHVKYGYASLQARAVALAKPPPCPGVKARYASLQARVGDLPDVCLLVADYMLCGVSQYWVHQNLGEHLDGLIVEDSKWQAR